MAAINEKKPQRKRITVDGRTHKSVMFWAPDHSTYNQPTFLTSYLYIIKEIWSTEYLITPVTFQTLHLIFSTYFLYEMNFILALAKDLYDIELFEEFYIIHRCLKMHQLSLICFVLYTSTQDVQMTYWDHWSLQIRFWENDGCGQYTMLNYWLNLFITTHLALYLM